MLRMRIAQRGAVGRTALVEMRKQSGITAVKTPRSVVMRAHAKEFLIRKARSY